MLEGGGMKGNYSYGVLDFFLDKGIEFSSCYGVSAGAIGLCSYLSKQRGRALRVGIDYMDNKDYCSLYSLLKTGDLFGVDMCYHKIPDELDPYDHETYEKYQGDFYSVVTNIETGEPEYIPIKDLKVDIEAIRASASLPLVSRNVQINGKLYLDGGISDGIPLRKSMEQGNQKNVIIMTKEIGYRRKPSSMLSIMKLRYRKYPKIYDLMKDRHIIYNETLDLIEKEVKAGNAFVIRPRKKSNVGRIEKDKEKLKALYQEGYSDAESCYEELLEFLNDAGAEEGEKKC